MSEIEQFAAERGDLLNSMDERIIPDVTEALRTREWTSLVDALVPVWQERYDLEAPGTDSSDALDAFKEILLSSLEKTTEDENVEAQVVRVSSWLSTFIVNDATHAAIAELGLSRQWVTRHDDKVRETHKDVDGDVRSTGEAFDVGGFPLHYPGEPVGPIELWIGCRCVLRPMAALTAAADPGPTDDPTIDDPAEPIPWHGVLAPVDVVSGDNRKFRSEGVTFREFPWPIRWVKVDDGEHKNAIVVANCTNAWVEDGLIKAEGFFAEVPEADEVIGLIATNMARGVSIDGDMAVFEHETLDGKPINNPDDIQDGDIVVQVFTEVRISAATIVPIPAFQEAYIEIGTWADAGECADCLSEDDPTGDPTDGNPTFAPGTRDGPGWITNPRATERIRVYWVRGKGAAKIRWGAPHDFYRCRRQLAKYVQNPEWLNGLCANMHKEALGTWPGKENGKHAIEGITMSPSVTLVASGQVKPLEWFTDPHLSGPTPLTITEDGRIFGHAASWSTCHIGVSDQCVTAPKSAADYGYFRTGSVLTDGGEIPVGQITMGTGHAPSNMGSRPAASHYDNTGSAVADVAVGEDGYGIWFAGALRDVSSEQIETLRASSLSGDWRRIGTSLELVAILAVNVPGFPIPRAAVMASGDHLDSLVAAGIVERIEPDPLIEVAKAAIREVRAEDARQARLAVVKDALAHEAGIRKAERLAAARDALGVK